MALGFTASAFQTSVKGLGALMGLLASSIIVIIALIDWVGGGLFRGESIYAMVVACITVLLVLVHIYKEKKEGDGDGGGMVMFGVLLAFFAALWLVMACLVTFRGPFIATGNGYFASVSVPFCMSIYIYNLNDRKFDSAYGTKDRLHLLAQVDLHVCFVNSFSYLARLFFGRTVGWSCLCMLRLLRCKAQRQVELLTVRYTIRCKERLCS